MAPGSTLLNHFFVLAIGKQKGSLLPGMPALVIKSFPEHLHERLRQAAAAHRRSVTQEAICMIESGLNAEPASASSPRKAPYWASSILLPEYRALIESGALSAEHDSTLGLSEERDAR